MKHSLIKLFVYLIISLSFFGGNFFDQVSLAGATDLDSDADGYSDDLEIASGYSPFNAAPVKLTESDVDKDGLSDYWELKLKTDPLQVDTDQDGYWDGVEVDWAFSPVLGGPERLEHHIEIDLLNQQLSYMVAGEPWQQFAVSTGKPSMPTPSGSFQIINKNAKAWSASYQLWMPYWLGLGTGVFGIHELPIWPGGQREGENHLGTPVSHGCIRLGVGSAEYLFRRVEIGTAVLIK